MRPGQQIIRQVREIDTVLQEMINAGQWATAGSWVVHWARSHKKDFNGVTIRDINLVEIARIPNELQVKTEADANAWLLSWGCMLPLIASMLQKALQNLLDDYTPASKRTLLGIIKMHKEWEQSRETHA